MAKDKGKQDKRGLASADQETKERVAKAGGEAFHEKRGQHGTDKAESKDEDR